MRRLWFALPWALVLAEGGLLLAPRVWARFSAPAPAPLALRGARLYRSEGCVACHGPGATGGHPNPGSKDDTVPGFTGGTPMMYAENDAELRQYILEGMPEKDRHDAAYLAARKKAALRMPAFRGRLKKGQVDALVAFIHAVSGQERPDDDHGGAGFDLAVNNGCFDCHGAMGMGGVRNPGSFTGVIPGFVGPDFAELVHSDAELRSWILKGAIPRLAHDPAANHFLKQQAIHMPAFGSHLSAAQIDALVTLVHVLRKR